jgi:sensor histidine kinase YesM
MKSILRQFLNQESVTNRGRFNVEGLFYMVRRSPVIFIWSIWTAYLGFDIIVRLSSHLTFTSLKIIALNYLVGGIFNQFWFFVFLPNLFFLRRWAIPLALFLVGFSGFILLKFFLLGAHVFQNVSINSFVVLELVRIFQFLLFTTIIWGFSVIINLENEKYKLQIEFEKLQVEHKSLQLSPHFVLNLISQFSASILPLSRSLFDDLGYFTSLLSYSYKDPQAPNFLAEEVLAMESYIVCQKRRFGEKLLFLVSKNFSLNEVKNLPLPKWVFMTLIENVFKHGNCVQPDFPCMLTMKVVTKENGIKLFTLSIVNALETSTTRHSTKFGIDAVNRILNFHFLDRYKIFLSESESEFNLFLYIEYERNFKNWSS